MAQEEFDAARFHSQYDRNQPLDLARFQRTVEDFMVILRSNELRCLNDQRLLDDFCIFVDDRELWHLAQTSIPEFRSAKKVEQRDTDAKDGLIVLDYVLDKLTLLPPPRSDKNVLISEQDLISQRHKLWVESIVTGGTGGQTATPAQRAECEERISQIDRAVAVAQPQDSCQAAPRTDSGKGRGKQILQGAKERIENGPMDNYIVAISQGGKTLDR